MHLLLVALAAAGVTVAPDSVRTLSGVSLPETIEVGGQALVLNGMALRKKFVVSVYVAGLYVWRNTHSPDEILAEDAPRRMVMAWKHDVDRGKICDGWKEGLENNTPDPSAEVRQQFDQLCELMEDIKSGETFVFTYLPAEGTQVEVRGQVKGTISGKAFADALLRCWIGPKPGPGEGFKKKLLGLES
jgi:hypothetical protein